MSVDTVQRQSVSGDALKQFDDLQVVSKPILDDKLFTLCGVLRNEMYFLPSFLHHYRRLGVERFIFIDDRSDDGSLEYLLRQPDVMVLQSNYRYGDTVKLPAEIEKYFSLPRILYVWRALLHEKYTLNRWALQVDIDEYVHLPDKMAFQDLVSRLEQKQVDAVYAVMLDMYPARFEDLLAECENTELNLNLDWYFDGEQHLKLNAARRPTLVHPGARARLFQRYGVHRDYHKFGLAEKMSFLKELRKTRFGRKIISYNQIHKPVLSRWRVGDMFYSSHKTSLTMSDEILLPMPHYRFTGALYSRVERAIREGSYSAGSRDYKLVSQLLGKMASKNGSFLYRKSHRLDEFTDFAAAQNAIGIS